MMRQNLMSDAELSAKKNTKESRFYEQRGNSKIRGSQAQPASESSSAVHHADFDRPKGDIRLGETRDKEQAFSKKVGRVNCSAWEFCIGEKKKTAMVSGEKSIPVKTPELLLSVKTGLEDESSGVRQEVYSRNLPSTQERLWVTRRESGNWVAREMGAA